MSQKKKKKLLRDHFVCPIEAHFRITRDLLREGNATLVKNDGVQLGSHHERGEQHRWGQCPHDALLLQTVWDSARNTAVVFLFLDDPPVVHVLGSQCQQHKKKNICWISFSCLWESRKGLSGDKYDRFNVGDLYRLLCRHRRFRLQFLCSANGFAGDRQLSCAAAHRCISVYCAPSESAEEHDVLYPVFLCYGSHLLHSLHVYDSVVVPALRLNLGLVGGAGSPVARQGRHSVPAHYRHNLLLSPVSKK